MLSETLQEIALAAAESLALDEVLTRIVEGLVETGGIALARIWLLGPGDLCASCAMRPECADQTRCLHLVASSGRPLVAPPGGLIKKVGIRKKAVRLVIGNPLLRSP